MPGVNHIPQDLSKPKVSQNFKQGSYQAFSEDEVGLCGIVSFMAKTCFSFLVDKLTLLISNPVGQ